MKKRKYVLFAFVFATALVQGQNNQLPLFNSPRGPAILFGGSSLNSDGTDINGTRFALSRSEENGANEQELKLPGKVKSLQAFKKITGAVFLQQLEKQLKLNSDEALWNFINQHRDLSAYGFAAFSIPFRTAMGAAYTDEEVKSKQNRTYLYTVTVSAPGRAGAKISAPITIGETPDFPAPKLIRASAKDSVVTITWREIKHRDMPYVASVFRQTGGSGAFVKQPARILAKRKGDSVIYVFSDKVNGNSSYRYFIRPADLADNAGAVNSDTASLVAANYSGLPILQGLKTTDTLNSLLVSWKPLLVNPLISGIEIQRSRDSRGDYVVIDTVSALAGSYQDRKLVPHIAYYYRLCVLHNGKQEQKEKFYAAVSGVMQKSNAIPDAPYGFTAQTTARGVRLAWQPAGDPDFANYFVYRGNSVNAKMEVISTALTDTTFTDTSSNLSRETSYVYAVKAVNTGSKESPFSRKVSARLPKGKEKPLTPGGIRTSPAVAGIHIEWDDTKRNDPGVMGYLLYKHPVGKTSLHYDNTKPASEEATRLNLTMVISGIITVPFFDDTVSHTGQQFEYLVSAIDRFGVESGLSPVGSAARMNVLNNHPPAKVFVRNVPAGVSLQWQQADMTGVQGFSIYRRNTTDGKKLKIAQVNNGTTEFTDQQTSHGNLYAYTLTAITAFGESAPTEEYTVRK